VNRRDSIKAAVAGFMGALCPWGAKAEPPPKMVFESRAKIKITKWVDCECCQTEPDSWIATIKYLPSNATFSIGLAESKKT